MRWLLLTLLLASCAQPPCDNYKEECTVSCTVNMTNAVTP